MATEAVQIILAKIEEIESRPVPTEGYTPTRYPFTYAYDYLRGHAVDFEIDPETSSSRGATAGWLRQQLGYGSDDQRIRPVVEALADAYMRQWHIERPTVGQATPVTERTD